MFFPVCSNICNMVKINSMKWQIETELQTGWRHVNPLYDFKLHKLEGLDCTCEPEINWEYRIVIHNAWDIREAQEYINKVE